MHEINNKKKNFCDARYLCEECDVFALDVFSVVVLLMVCVACDVLRHRQCTLVHLAQLLTCECL